MAVCPTCGRDVGDASYCPHDGTPLAHLGRGPAAMPSLGDVVDGRYRLLSELGKGGMAMVFAAHAEALGQEVALKVLYPRWGDHRKTVARFAREARATSQIDHPNVVKVYDFGYAPEGFYFLAMEKLDGRPLAGMVAPGKGLRPGRAIRFLLQIADGMARAHELGVVHRDLKPDNVMVRREGGRETLTLVDFGLSKITEGDGAPVTAQGDVIGTPDFMAPEQWQGLAVDARADVYAFGVMAYELLSGELPFGGDTLIQKLQQHLYSVALPLGDHPRVPRLPEGLSDLVMRCMAKDPVDRPPHMGRVITTLLEIEERSRAEDAERTRAGIGEPPAATIMQAPDDVGMDRSGLTSELRRLTRVRQAKLIELVPSVFASTPPSVEALLREIGELEGALARAEEDFALAEASLQEAQRAHRAKEAQLRAQLVAANLARAVGRRALPSELMEAGDADTIAMDGELETRAEAGSGPPEDGPLRALREAEAKLAAFVHAPDDAIDAATAQREDARARVDAAEGPVHARYDALERALREGRGADPSRLGELAQLDGAIATYRARLELLAHHERRKSGA